MAHDSFDLDIPRPPPSELRPFPESLPPPRPAPRNPARHMVLAGVCGACVMGAGLGLWARPAEGERQVSAQALAKPQAAAPHMRQLQIVVDDAPAPLGVPMEVLRAVGNESLSLEPFPPEPEPIAPTVPPAGLVRVLTTPLPVETADPPHAPTPVAQARKVEARKVEVRKAEPKVAKKAEAKRVEPKKADPPKASARKKPAKDDVRVAADKTPKTKSEKAKGGTKLAKAKPDRKKEPPKLAKADRPSKVEKVRLAKAERTKADKAKAKAQLAAKAETLKLAKAKSAKPRVEKAEAAPVRKPPAPVKGAGPLRMVSNTCTSSDVAENLVCADPSLGAADRRLARAYRQAEAAGVPTRELRRQQERWLAARAAAAREAPWAVQDVYQARIAELEDLTRDAGY